MALTKREQEINNLRDQALMVALDHLLEFINPDDPQCSVDPDVRKASAQYLESWVAGPLAAALNLQNLGDYRQSRIRRAQEYLELTKN